jgi:mono/diheme cytochrome c family protein
MATGCYPKAAQAPGPLSAGAVTWASTRWPGVTESSLSKGRDLFLSKCNGCHGYPDLAAIDDKHWPDIVESMAKKSHLDAWGRDAVLHYVLAARSEQASR